MNDPTWLPISVIYVVHDRQISRHGGTPGIRDRALIEMGCARPLNLWAYGEPDIFDLAAGYAFGIAKAHGFVDGNKRTALVAALTFLSINGIDIVPDQMTAVRQMEGLAEGTVPEAEFARWLRDTHSA
ncbi:type II toxin-antitoxin system death-on-curing family toxin [Yoonia sp. 2307UL14-13]|uniref:type II toxin-antitoxin system death-on-curing family toxin n=1 Tax=Yoonia sp. 2307UL14-13 TaxID=3126506 RepID=UPI00309CFF6E